MLPESIVRDRGELHPGCRYRFAPVITERGGPTLSKAIVTRRVVDTIKLTEPLSLGEYTIHLYNPRRGSPELNTRAILSPSTERHLRRRGWNSGTMGETVAGSHEPTPGMVGRINAFPDRVGMSNIPRRYYRSPDVYTRTR